MLGECCMHLHHPYLVPKERSKKKMWHMSHMCHVVFPSAFGCPLIRSGGYELFSDVIH